MNQRRHEEGMGGKGKRFFRLTLHSIVSKNAQRKIEIPHNKKLLCYFFLFYFDHTPFE